MSRSSRAASSVRSPTVSASRGTCSAPPNSAAAAAIVDGVQRHAVHARRRAGARLVERDVRVASEAEDGEVDRCGVEHGLVARGLGLGSAAAPSSASRRPIGMPASSRSRSARKLRGSSAPSPRYSSSPSTVTWLAGQRPVGGVAAQRGVQARAAYGRWAAAGASRVRARMRLATSSAAVSPTWWASSRTSSDGGWHRSAGRGWRRTAASSASRPSIGPVDELRCRMVRSALAQLAARRASSRRTWRSSAVGGGRACPTRPATITAQHPPRRTGREPRRATAVLRETTESVSAARRPDVARRTPCQRQVMSATEPLSPLDATFLELEDADPTAHMHIGGVLVFDPLPGGGTPTLTRVRRHLERRLEALPRYRQRLSRRTTGGLRWPEWEPDERFDIAAHVTRAALPRPGGERELLAWAADFWSHRLDRARPALARRAARGPRRRPLGARHQDPPLPRGRRRLDRRGHGAARCRAEARAVEAADPDASRACRRQRERAAPLGRPADGGGRGDRGGGSPSAARRRGARRRARTARAAHPRRARRRAADERQRPAQRASPAGRHRGAARGDQGDQAGARRDGQRRHPLARHRRAARAARGARGDPARRGPACDGARQRPCRGRAPRARATASPRCSSISRSRWASRAPATDRCVRRP